MQKTKRECNNCHGELGEPISTLVMFFMMMFLSSGTFILGILFFPLWLGTIAFLFLGIMILFKPKGRYASCKDCKQTFKID